MSFYYSVMLRSMMYGIINNHTYTILIYKSICHHKRLLRVPWTIKRSDQSILKEINPKYSLEGLMLKLKLQYFVHLMWGANSLEKTFMLGKIEGKKRRGLWRVRWLDSISDSKDMILNKLQVIMKDRVAWRAAVHGGQSQTLLSNWTTACNHVQLMYLF